MPRFSILSLAALCASISGISLPSVAQETLPARPSSTQVANVTTANFATLPALLGRRSAISLEIDGAALDAAPNSRDALLDWTRRGGIVFLHNDAARFFGYQTVEARLGTNRQAGQIYGRAVSALPFASHPLLQGPKTAARPVDPSRLPSVNVVFYTMNEGDHLVLSHPAGTPVLEVTDLAGVDNRPLYACAVAPFGRGFAVFTPASVDQRRGDGAAFAANLLAMLPTVVPPAAAPNAAMAPSDGAYPKYVGISQNAIVGGTATLGVELQRALEGDEASSPALPPLGAPAPPPANATNIAPVEAEAGGAVQDTDEATAITPTRNTNQPPVLLLSRVEALGAQAALQTSPAATLGILRTRVAILKGDIPAANALLAELIQNAPNASETAFLNAILNANLANDLSVSSVVRSEAARTASDEFTRSLSSRPTIATATRPNDAAGALISGSTATQIRLYATEMARLARLFSFDPPLVTAIGRGRDAIVVRYAPGDFAYNAVLEAAQLISTSRLVGWRNDRQEILLFPNQQTYVAYRAASGQTGQNVPLPAANGGDVVGSRILMASAPVDAVPFALTFLARLQAYSLLTAWFDGSGRIPAWMAIGLENQVAQLIGVEAIDITGGQTLEQFVRVGGLLTPAQFEAQRADPTVVARLQATSLIDYFYKVYGAGAFTETVQRLASGQNADTALGATTQRDQLGFFQSWRDAQFGPRTFPNRG